MQYGKDFAGGLHPARFTDDRRRWRHYGGDGGRRGRQGDQSVGPTPGSLEAAVGPDELGFEEIVFVKRKPYSSNHYYTDINNGTSPDRFLPDNGIYVYNLRTRSERAVVRAADMPGGKGFIGKISLSFDAKKVVFDFRQDPGSGFRIWEVRTDGTGLRQVSFPPPDEAEKAARWRKGWHTDDIHPCYLPDGKIIFSSTRCEHTVLCGGSAHLVAPGLHRMDADGSHVEQLTKSPVSEFCPVVLDDGRVMYHRWEYIDKGARVAKTVWAMNPDGTKPQELYGLADDDTTIYMYPQPLPGSNHRFVCVGTCHYPQGGCLGPILLVDFGMGVAGRGPDPGRSGLRPRRCAIPGCQYHAAGVHPAADGTGVAFPDRKTASMWTTGKAGRGTFTRILIPSASGSSWSPTRSIPADHYQRRRQRLRLVPDRYRGAPSPDPRRCETLLLASPAAGRSARPAAGAIGPRSTVCRRQPGPLRRGQCLPGHGGGQAGGGQMAAHQ